MIVGLDAVQKGDEYWVLKRKKKKKRGEEHSHVDGYKYSRGEKGGEMSKGGISVCVWGISLIQQSWNCSG